MAEMARPVKLERGRRVQLQNLGGGPLSRVMLGVTWKNPQCDIDVCALLLGSNGLVPDSSFFLYRRNLQLPNLSGFVRSVPVGVKGGHDRAQVMLDLSALPVEVSRVLVAASAVAQPGYGPPDLANATTVMTRVMDMETGHTSYVYIQDPQALLGQTCLVLWELQRTPAGWLGGVRGLPYVGGPPKLARDHGVMF